MPKPTYITVPQRSDGRGYVDCQPHRATSWAVKKVEKRRSEHGRYLTVSAIISRHDTRAQADLDRDHHTRSHQPLTQAYKLGRRMGVRA